MEMNPETLAALNESIEHWERMASGNRMPEETHSSRCCALCAMFAYGGNSKMCAGCPVDYHHHHCGGAGSPWVAAHIAREEHSYDSPEFKAAAANMVTFLKSLRPQ